MNQPRTHKKMNDGYRLKFNRDTANRHGLKLKYFIISHDIPLLPA